MNKGDILIANKTYHTDFPIVPILIKDKSYTIKTFDGETITIDSEYHKDHKISIDSIPYLFYTNKEMRKFKLEEISNKLKNIP